MTSSETPNTSELSPQDLAARGREVTGLSIYKDTNDDINMERVHKLLADMNSDVPQGGTDIVYGEREAQRLRLWKPTSSSTKAPVIVYVHGGSWTIGTYLDSTGSKKVSYFNGLGYAFASINYTLIPKITVKEQVQEIADSVAYLIKHAEELNIDPERVVLMGHSSGAHVVTLLGTDPSYTQKAGFSIDVLKGVIALDGSNYNALAEFSDSTGPIITNMVKGLSDDPERLQDMSPTHHAAAPNAGAFLLLHSSRQTCRARSKFNEAKPISTHPQLTMPPRKRSAPAADASEEAAPKRRSLRQAAKTNPEPEAPPPAKASPPKKAAKVTNAKKQEKPKAPAKPSKTEEPDAPKVKKAAKKQEPAQSSSRGVSEDPDIDSIPTINPDAPKHDGQWYWLMKAEPETRIENGVDVKFSIDDLKAKAEPEGWDGIRAYAGSARRPGAPYYDPKSTKEKPIWDLVHVEFRKKFAVPIGLKELRELGKPGGPLEMMQLLKQSRLSLPYGWKIVFLCGEGSGIEANEGKPLIIIAAVFATLGSISAAINARLGAGTCIRDVDPRGLYILLENAKWAGIPAYNLATVFTKASVLMFYLRFTVDMHFIICAYAVLFIVVANCIFHIIAAIAYRCPAYEGENCQAIVDIYTASAVINSVSDLILLLLPFWLLHPMKVPLSRKIGIALILMAGGL
ncbi:hypothetical protein LZL87_006160 [Fusarium oxysporum]|nr:hypothetical protein LZL87_006160 [Fusarium oxysporum]